MTLPAQERIRQLYDPQLIGELGHRLMSLLTEHLQRVESGEGPVLNWCDPAENIAAARHSLSEHATLEHLPARFEQLVQQALSRGQNLHHPHYIGHQVPATVPIAGLFAALAAMTNQVMAIYEMGPWATAIERALIELWGTQIGLQPGTFAGLVTNGGSLANLTALLTARNVALGNVWETGLCARPQPPVLIVQSDAHYCIARSAGILGLGTRQVLRVPVNAQRQMDLSALRTLLSEQQRTGTPVIAVVASACATPIGAFDRLQEVADLCAEFGVWMHVDAAHGGATAFSNKYRHLISGLERADSFICDAHKTLFVPALCAFVFYRNRKHRFEAFRQDAPYLFDPSAPGLADFDSGMLTVECTKQAATYGLWGLIALCGPEVLGDLIDVTFDLTRWFYNLLAATDDFVPLHVPQCNILVFRYQPPAVRTWSPQQIGDLNRRIRREIIESGKFYIVQTNVDGNGAIRVCLMNPLTEERHLHELVATIRTVAQLQCGL